MEIYKYEYTEKEQPIEVIFSQTITKYVKIYILNSNNTKEWVGWHAGIYFRLERIYGRISHCAVVLI